MNLLEEQMPPLPKPDVKVSTGTHFVISHSDAQMLAYGRACVEQFVKTIQVGQEINQSLNDEIERLRTDCAGLRLALNKMESDKLSLRQALDAAVAMRRPITDVQK